MVSTVLWGLQIMNSVEVDRPPVVPEHVPEERLEGKLLEESSATTETPPSGFR